MLIDGDWVEAAADRAFSEWSRLSPAQRGGRRADT